MKTYLTVQFYSEGAKPSMVLSMLQSLGFRPATGFYDLQYDWEAGATLDDVVILADKIAATLAGTKVHFKLETTNPDN